MNTRMQPIRQIWDRVPRIVRDLTTQSGKQVRLEMDGDDTELDLTIIEAINDSLNHVVRNAIDHGFEMPELRVLVEKKSEGTLSLRAYYESGQVNIEIADDGAGISPDKVKGKAVEMGLITREQAARMSDRDAVHLIFQAGFSTVERGTSISGCGVGLDVVKKTVENIGGTLDLQSAVGEGTTLKIKLPLTIDIIHALIATCSGERLAIPQENLLELVREVRNGQQTIKVIDGIPVYHLRGRLLPLVCLDRQLELYESDKYVGSVNIVVLQADGHQFGLVVDNICKTEEIVVKPLCKVLKSLSMFAGATILGDGSVALILDVIGIAQRVRILPEGRTATRTDCQPSHQSDVSDEISLLLLAQGDKQLAIPLSFVSRLEEISRTEVEYTDGLEVVQYRGESMPIFPLSRNLAQDSTQEYLQVIVCLHQGRYTGLVAEQILDIVTAPAASKLESSRNGLLGSTVIKDRITDILDVPSIIRSAEFPLFVTMSGGRL